MKKFGALKPIIFLISIILILIIMYKFTGQVATKEHETFEIPPEKQSVPEKLISNDPFKEALEKQFQPKQDNQDLTRTVEVTKSKDPFKEFLDKQKQNSKNQVVSPFGKN